MGEGNGARQKRHDAQSAPSASWSGHACCSLCMASPCLRQSVASGLPPCSPMSTAAPSSSVTPPSVLNECTRPPIRPRASSTTTLYPRSVRLRAAEIPAKPAPTTTTRGASRCRWRRLSSFDASAAGVFAPAAAAAPLPPFGLGASFLRVRSAGLRWRSVNDAAAACGVVVVSTTWCCWNPLADGAAAARSGGGGGGGRRPRALRIRHSSSRSRSRCWRSRIHSGRTQPPRPSA